MSFRERTWGLRFRLREAVSRSWLVIPCMYVVAALVLGRFVPELIGDGPGPFLGLTLQPDSARGILEAVASGMITFTGLVVSIAVVVVQFGAGQYTPRLVLRFRRDIIVKNSLGIFIAPAIYALVCLGHVNSSGNEESATLTVAVALALLVAAVVAFFALTARLLDLLRPRRLFDLLRKAAEKAIDDVYPRPFSEDEPGEFTIPETGSVINNDGAEGVLSALDFAGLVEAARIAGVRVEVIPRIGGYVRRNAPIFIVFGRQGELDEKRFLKAAIIAEERTLTQDPAFAIRTTVDIAIRALSPAVNDPTTASQALDSLDSMLERLATRNLGVGFLADADGNPRVAYSAASWADLLDLSFTEIRAYGANSHQVARRMRSLLLGMVETVPERRRDDVRRQLKLLDEAIDRQYGSEGEREIARQPDHIGLGGRHRLPPDPVLDPGTGTSREPAS